MPQSLSLVIVHFVFSTKERFPFLQGDSRSSIFAYLASLCHDLDCQKCKVGGTADHVHVATTLPRTVSQAELVEFLKTRSSKWFKVEGRGQMARKFA